MAIKKSSQEIIKWKNNKAESKEQARKCLMAKVRSQSVCVDSLFKDLLLDHEKLLKLNTVILAMSKNYEQENSKLKEENNRLVKQAKCFENTLEELVSQKDFLQKENERLEDKNNVLLKEIDLLQNRNKSLEDSLNNSSSLISSLEKENGALTEKNLELSKECEFLKVNNNILQNEISDSKENFEKLQSSLDNSESQILGLKTENGTLKRKNSELNKEIDDLKNNKISFENVNSDFGNKFDKSANKFAKFNKGQNDLNDILSCSRPLHDKSGLGYNKTNHRTSTRYAFMYYKNLTASTKERVTRRSNFYRNSNASMTRNIYNRSTKRNINRNYLSIWVPVNWKNREKYIDDYFDSVVKNKNFIFKGTIKPLWVWLPLL